MSLSIVDPGRSRQAAARSTTDPKVALALAGGGPLGAIWEIGALCALEESIAGLKLNALDHYVGVSAGGFIAAALANGMTAREICRGFIENSDESAEVFDPSWLMQPAWGEFARRARQLPALGTSALWRFFVERRSLISALERLGPALPTGVFGNEEVHRRLSALFSREGRTNDFRRLRTRLTLVATDLDSGAAAPFGRPGWDHVPISRAVQASSALPGLFPPVEIDGKHYVDGALKKTLHATVVLDEGVDLLLCLNPLVPFDATAPAFADWLRRGLPAERRRIPRIIEGGLPAVLSQTFRTMIHSRLELGMKGYERHYPGTDILLFEPDHRDPELYLANTFSYSQRRQLAEHAYQQTRHHLRTHRSRFSHRLARHGMALDLEALEDPRRHLVQPVVPTSATGVALNRLEELLEDLADWVHDRERERRAA
ncbi:putative acylesterase/phospholipase RssA [Tibeticola sediminis]|uniref:Putative acylesterase/phospholipase RssA n=1 Tax=Tibeticola sediminis TaxID=1917811 RepID=A0A3N4VJL5_9BURK|nr:patatin-like phospholipase family protein [Tibeticola sediminis]RPE73154.1 putative acylesterase/phospholipase RssA [Tibeticola sediminis]